MTKNKNVFYFMIFLSTIFMIWAFAHSPKMHGDAAEYMGMTISFVNHLTPEVRYADYEFLRDLWAQQNIHIPFTGMYEALNGKTYIWHFFIYSALAAIPYTVLKLLHLNIFLSFQILNVIMYLIVLWWIVYKTNLSTRMKFWLVLIHLLNPVLLYLTWSSPEVFTYCFLFMALLKFINKRYMWACLLAAIGSLQNPALSIVPLAVWCYILYRDRKITKELIYCTIASAVVLVQYVFYYMLYHTPSMIGKLATSSELITFNRIASLFYDLNFGLIVYVPVLLGVTLWGAWKKDKIAIMSVLILIIFAFICSPQMNWNSGMMYINRYNVWFIPLLAIGPLIFIDKMNRKRFIALSSAFAITTGIITIVCISQYKEGNHVSFSPLAKLVISVAPALYNPPVEIFAERALGGEIDYSNKFPIIIADNTGKIRKVLVKDTTSGLTGYVNGGLSTHISDLRIINVIPAGSDIFTQDTEASFSSGWEGLEQHDSVKYRWASEKSELMISNSIDQAKISFAVSRFASPSNLRVFLNDVQVYEGVVGTDSKVVSFNANLNGNSKITIVSDEKGTAPKDIIPGNNDPRKISLAISDFTIK